MAPTFILAFVGRLRQSRALKIIRNAVQTLKSLESIIIAVSTTRRVLDLAENHAKDVRTYSLLIVVTAARKFSIIFTSFNINNNFK